MRQAGREKETGRHKVDDCSLRQAGAEREKKQADIKLMTGSRRQAGRQAEKNKQSDIKLTTVA